MEVERKEIPLQLEKKAFLKFSNQDYFDSKKE